MDRWAPDDAVIAALRQSMDEAGVIGLAAAVLCNGVVVWEGGFGWSDIDNRRPMTPDTRIGVASVSKTITATAVLQLVEDGRMGLDDDVSLHVGFEVRSPSHPARVVTLRHLLTHTSGIIDAHDGAVLDREYGPGDPRTPLDVWLKDYLTVGGGRYSATDNFSGDVPGSRFHYCNVGFALLGLVVQRAAGVEFPEYCRREIFQPLGMTHTGWLIGDIDPLTHSGQYTRPEDAEIVVVTEHGAVSRPATPDELIRQPLYSYPTYPDGSLHTTVRDYSRFIGALLNPGPDAEHGILGPETVGRMLLNQIPQVPEDDLRGGAHVQGLGWNALRRSRDGTVYWGHEGDDPGMASLVRFRVSDGVGVLIFENTDTGWRHRRKLALLLLDALDAEPESDK